MFSPQGLSDEAAKVVYQMKRAKSADGKEQKVATLKNWVLLISFLFICQQ